MTVPSSQLKYTNTPHWQNVEFQYVTAGGTYSDHLALKGYEALNRAERTHNSTH
jgi:hypothetical protein